MIHQEIIDYYNRENPKGIAHDQIVTTLVQAGWKLEDINESLTHTITSKNIVENTSSKPVIVIPYGSTQSTITEVNYPIESIWILKNTVGTFFGMIVFSLFEVLGIFGPRFIYYFIFYIFFTIWNLVVYALRRKNFHFSTEPQYFVFKQGILSKQQRNIPYGVIQNVFINRDIFDRLFGLASLSIENAAQAGGQYGGAGNFGGYMTNSNRQMDPIGFQGNKVSIPGLTEKNAENLKTLILQKMKENPLRESNSGL